MIKSMTGFGRAEAQDEQHKFTVEIKSVNHRYLDFNIKMPKKLSFFDSAIRTLLKEYMLRGKVDVFISYEDFTQSHMILQYNREVAGQYMAYFKEMADTFGIRNDITAAELGRFQDVFTMEEADLAPRDPHRSPQPPSSPASAGRKTVILFRTVRFLPRSSPYASPGLPV